MSNAVAVTSIPVADILNLSYEQSTEPAYGKGNGTGLLGFYFANTNSSGKMRIRLDPTVNFDWGTSEPLEGIGKDYFGVIWMGEVEAPATGEWTFNFISDDGGRMQIGDQLIEPGRSGASPDVAKTMLLVGGKKYPLMLFYFDYIGVAKAHLSWSGPGTPKTIIPPDRLYPASYITEHKADVKGENGLLATYYQGAEFNGPTSTRIDRTLDFQGISASNSSVRWTGQLQPPNSEQIAFYIVSDGAVRLMLAGKTLLEKPNPNGLTEIKTVGSLTAGERYDFQIDLAKGGVARLFWSSPSIPKAIIPAGNLFPSRAAQAYLSPVGPATRLPAGIIFRNGSFVACRIESADQDVAQCSRLLEGKPIPTHELARIVCQPVPVAFSAKLQPGRRGVLLANGDFIDGEFVALEGNRVQMSSVLFGLRTFETSRQVLAIAIRDIENSENAVELQLKDQSTLAGGSLDFEDGHILVSNKAWGTLSVAEGELVRATVHNR